MSAAMGREIQQAVAAINAEPRVRVVVVSGAGTAFSAGGDIKSLAKEAGLAETGEGLGGGAAFYRSFLSVKRLEVPTIAAINGHAIGAGLCFALGCDLRVMHAKAKVGVTFVKLGIHPGMAATWHLPGLVGPAVSAELLYTGRLVGAEEALSMGLVNRTAAEDFEAVVEELASEIAANAPLAIRALKKTLACSGVRSLDETLETEARAQAETFTTEDAAEGIKAVLEKRRPQFRGR